MSRLLPLFYFSVLYGAFFAGMLYLRAQDVADHAAAQPFPRATVLLLLAIGVPTTLQFFFAPLLPLFERDTQRFLDGEWWRLITPLFVQDGGIGGSIFNLVSLFFVGLIGERLWGSWRCIAIFFVCGILSEAVALSWQPIGAGNSIANFGLAASVAIVALISTRQRLVQLAAGLALASGLVLVLLRDIHGAATILGVIVGMVWLWLSGGNVLKTHTSA